LSWPLSNLESLLRVGKQEELRGFDLVEMIEIAGAESYLAMEMR